MAKYIAGSLFLFFILISSLGQTEIIREPKYPNPDGTPSEIPFGHRTLTSEENQEEAGKMICHRLGYDIYIKNSTRTRPYQKGQDSPLINAGFENKKVDKVNGKYPIHLGIFPAQGNRVITSLHCSNKVSSPRPKTHLFLLRKADLLHRESSPDAPIRLYGNPGGACSHLGYSATVVGTPYVAAKTKADVATMNSDGTTEELKINDNGIYGISYFKSLVCTKRLEDITETENDEE